MGAVGDPVPAQPGPVTADSRGVPLRAGRALGGWPGAAPGPGAPGARRVPGTCLSQGCHAGGCSCAVGRCQRVAGFMSLCKIIDFGVEHGCVRAAETPAGSVTLRRVFTGECALRLGKRNTSLGPFSSFPLQQFYSMIFSIWCSSVLLLRLFQCSFRVEEEIFNLLINNLGLGFQPFIMQT